MEAEWAANIRAQTDVNVLNWALWTREEKSQRTGAINRQGLSKALWEAIQGRVGHEGAFSFLLGNQELRLSE